MATNAMLYARHSRTNQIHGIYVHWDGDSCFATLNEYYKTQDRVDELIELGSLSYLAQHMHVPEGREHSYENPDHDTCLFHHRDCHESLNILTLPEDVHTVQECLSTQTEEYNYFYCPEKQGWLAYKGDEPVSSWNASLGLSDADFANVQFKPSFDLASRVTAVNSIMALAFKSLSAEKDPISSLIPLYKVNKLKKDLSVKLDSESGDSDFSICPALSIKQIRNLLPPETIDSLVNKSINPRMVDQTQPEEPKSVDSCIDASSDPILQADVNTYLKQKAELEALEKSVKILSNKIKDKFAGLDYNKLTEGRTYEIKTEHGNTISLTEVVSNRLDSAALKKAHPDLYSSFCKESTTIRLAIK